MKIGLLNPWVNAAENQLIPAIARVAASLGHTTVECKTTKDVLEQRPDFILSMSRTQPKLTDIPTYGLIFDPRHIVIERPSYLHGIFSYDGVFTIFDTLHEFLSDLLFAARSDVRIGYFYPTAPVMVWEVPISFASARLAYFGINWDRRRHDLFALLDTQPWMEIYGPEGGWKYLKGSSYKGMVPFDGTSVLERYRGAGAGLCLFSDSHFSENIITSRVFEICAAGAVVIAPRMPWLEQNFGDAVLYIDQNRSDYELFDQIDRHMRWIRENPGDAALLAARSQRVFEERFSLEALFPNVLGFHRAHLMSSQPCEHNGTISVIVVCENPSTDALKRTLEGVARQNCRHVELVIMAKSSSDAAACEDLVRAYESHFERCEVSLVDVSRNSNLLWSGLERCSGELIAVLNCGDEWMSDHLASMLKVLHRTDGKRIAFSGSIVHYEKPFVTRGGNLENRRINPFPFTPMREDVVYDALSIPISSVMFRKAMLDTWTLSDPGMSSKYDAYLVMSLLQKEAPAFTYRATAVMYQPDQAAQPMDDPSAAEDITRLRLRFVGLTFPPAPRLVDLEALQAVVERGETRRQGETASIERHGDLCLYRVPASFEYLVGPDDSWEPVPVRVSLEDLVPDGQTRPRLHQDGSLFPLVVEPPHESWARGLLWRIAFPEERPYVVRLYGRVESGTAGFGVVAGASEYLTYRVFVPGQIGDVVVDLPISHPAEVVGIVIQATLGGQAVRVIIEGIQVLAATARFPLAATKRLLEEAEQVRMERVTATEELTRAKEQLEEENRQLQKSIRAMRSSRVWKIGTLYWRLLSRKN